MSINQNDKSFVVRGTRFAAPAQPAGLYLVSTPIGNLADITLRALEVLSGADLILCEDTRTSAKLLNHFSISTRRMAFHEHNERARAEGIVERIADGQAVALISDAGTPLVSDPGFPLVRAAREAGVPVFAVPGASALLAGLSIGGLPTDQFTFVGFLPPKTAARRKKLAALADRPETLVFYESPRRLAHVLADMAEEFGPRQAVVALELTKRHERSFADRLDTLAAQFADEPQKGEAVIMVSGAKDEVPDEAEWMAALTAALKDRPVRSAVDEISSDFGIRRKTVYDAALALKK